jgi:hypothetical protein
MVVVEVELRSPARRQVDHQQASQPATSSQLPSPTIHIHSRLTVKVSRKPPITSVASV